MEGNNRLRTTNVMGSKGEKHWSELSLGDLEYKPRHLNSEEK